MHASRLASAIFGALLFLVTTKARADETSHDRSPFVHLSLEGGATFASFGGVAFSGYEIGAGVLFAPAPHLSVGVLARYLDTRSDAGLHLRWGSVVSGDILWTPWRMRIGGGTDLLYFVLPRVTEDARLGHPGVGLHGHVGIDILEGGPGHGLEIAAIPAADWFFGASLTSVTLVAAVRW